MAFRIDEDYMTELSMRLSLICKISQISFICFLLIGFKWLFSMCWARYWVIEPIILCKE